MKDAAAAGVPVAAIMDENSLRSDTDQRFAKNPQQLAKASIEAKLGLTMSQITKKAIIYTDLQGTIYKTSRIIIGRRSYFLL